MNTANAKELWYRFDDNSDGETVLTKYPVLKHTPCGVWIDTRGADRWCSKDGVRRPFACPDKDDALESFLARKHAQRSIIRNQMDRVEKAIIDGHAVKSGIRKPIDNLFFDLKSTKNPCEEITIKHLVGRGMKTS